MTTINSKAIRAAIAANLALRGGFFPLLFTTALWGFLVWFRPGFHTAFSIWYLATFGAWEGLGFRLCCAAPRSWLVPGLREHYRLIRFIALPAVSCAIAATSGNSGTFPALLAILWLCALAGFYMVALSRRFVATLAAAMFLGMFLGVVFGATGPGRQVLQHRVVFGLVPQWAVLLLLDVALAMWMWRRIGTQRDLTWIQPGAGAFSSWLAARRRKKLASSPRVSRPSPASVQHAIRFLSFDPTSLETSAKRRQSYLSGILFWLCFADLFLFHNPGKDRLALTFYLLLIAPLVPGCSLSASARMFMLPLRRSEIIRRLAAGQFLAQMRFWIAMALPFSVVALLNGIALPTVCLALAATLVGQLPTFGLMLWAGSMMTASGIRYTVIVGLVLIFASAFFFFLPHWLAEPWAVAGTIPLSLALGLMLIRLAYRRWFTTEVGAWVSLPAKS